jgi:hypothetical protein
MRIDFECRLFHFPHLPQPRPFTLELTIPEEGYVGKLVRCPVCQRSLEVRAYSAARDRAATRRTGRMEAWDAVKELAAALGLLGLCAALLFFGAFEWRSWCAVWLALIAAAAAVVEARRLCRAFGVALKKDGKPMASVTTAGEPVKESHVVTRIDGVVVGRPG